MTLLDKEYLTIARATELLKISRSTLWRWISAGELPAYRFGHRRVLVKEKDLRALIAPARGEKAVATLQVERGRLLRPLTKQEQERALAALGAAEQLSRELLKERGGHPFADSAGILRAMRGERSRCALDC